MSEERPTKIQIVEKKEARRRLFQQLRIIVAVNSALLGIAGYLYWLAN
jgi:hypothetical protein